MPSYISKKLAVKNALLFKESFDISKSKTVDYVFIGNHVPYTDETIPDTIYDTVQTEKYIWDNMYAAKKITSLDVELVVPKVTWTGNTHYRQYDDKALRLDLLSANTSQNLKPMYVMTSNNDVYLCVCNNVSSNSTVEPFKLDSFSANGNIQLDDGYSWKYLYSINTNNRFLTDYWIPVPTSLSKLEYSSSVVVSVPGEVLKIKMENRGSGYIHSDLTVSAFTTGCTVLTVLSTTDNVSPDLYNALANTSNMSISGVGIGGTTYIKSVDPTLLRITLPLGASSNGGGTSNVVSISTRIHIDGDGSSAIGSPRLSGNTIDKITMSSYGKGYTFANVYIYGTGTGAQARAILPPKYGHGYNTAYDLGANTAMVSIKMGVIDSTESGIISLNTTIRQYGLLSRPYKYGKTIEANNSTANAVISQTTNIDLIAGGTYAVNEFVYQGDSASTAYFSGYINAYTSNQVRLTRVKGNVQIGYPLSSASNPSGRRVTAVTPPELEPYTGDIVYANNITNITRTSGQAENFKFIIQF